jgi:DNA-binding response OmpR family regulator
MALILLVDDSHLGRTLAHLTLTRAGHRVIVARDGREGLDLAQAHNPDLIVAACTLPVLDGVTMVRSLRERGIAPPVILVGSGPGWVDGSHGAAWDGSEFISISRSIEPHELARAVQTALNPIVAKAA